jgi:hypothetical protein
MVKPPKTAKCVIAASVSNYIDNNKKGKTKSRLRRFPGGFRRPNLCRKKQLAKNPESDSTLIRKRDGISHNVTASITRCYVEANPIFQSKLDLLISVSYP